MMAFDNRFPFDSLKVFLLPGLSQPRFAEEATLSRLLDIGPSGAGCVLHPQAGQLRLFSGHLFSGRFFKDRRFPQLLNLRVGPLDQLKEH